MAANSPSKRIEALDYLRGFFILVIIVDHLWRWPNLLQYVSGRGELWVSAAEGFVIISGLLVGYVRGRKGLKKPFREISKKLIARGALLYLWSFITTVAFVAATWYITFRSNIAYVPYEKGDWLDLIRDIITLQYNHILTHFLYLYAIFLVLSPVLIWLLRQGLWWVGLSISLATWLLGVMFDIEWMQWQILFYIPTIAGFYLDQIIVFCRRIPPHITRIIMITALASIVLSAAIILPHDPGTYTRDVFGKEPLSLARIGLSFVWFVALAWLFNKTLRWLDTYIGWLLLPFGTKSLTAYIVHGFVLMMVALIIPLTTGFWINTLLVCVAILTTWTIVRIPHINRVIPR